MQYAEYTIHDLSEYNTFLHSMHVDKTEFIDNLNIVTSSDSQLCDFNAMLSYVRDIDKYSFKYIVSSLNRETKYYRIWYLYFKFLLLDDDIKDTFNETYIKKFIHMNGLFDSDNGDYKEDWNDILQLFYKLVNDDNLQSFMDINDNYGQYKRLDLSKKHNIVYKKDIYIDNHMLDVFEDSVENFDLAHFCYNIIYCISDKYGYDKIEQSNGFIDFQQRFHSNIDKGQYIIMWNSMSITYFSICGRNKSEQEKMIENIPIDKMGCLSRYGNFNGDKVVKLNQNERYKLVSDLFREIFLSSSNKFNEIYDDLFRFYLERVLKYDIQEDKYKLFYYRYNSYNDNKIEFILEKRYKNYLQSKLVKGLDYLNSRVYSLLLNINLDENLKELKIFIEKILDEFNYHNLIHF